MLVHLPIVLLATLSPIPISDTVPQFDIVKECSFESESSANFKLCSQDESAALAELRNQWSQFDGAGKSSCVLETRTGGFTSYVELLTCLEMARDADNARGRPASPGLQPAELKRPGVTVGIGHGAATLKSGQ
jgi:hypothetical protein